MATQKQPRHKPKKPNFVEIKHGMNCATCKENCVMNGRSDVICADYWNPDVFHNNTKRPVTT